MGSQHHRGRRIKPSRIGSDLSDKLGMVSECVSAYKDREIAVHRGVSNDGYRSGRSFESRRQSDGHADDADPFLRGRLRAVLG